MTQVRRHLLLLCLASSSFLLISLSPSYFSLSCCIFSSLFSVTQLLLCSQNRNRTTEAAIDLLILCFLLCVRFQCVTGSGRRWRETSWWRSTIPSSSNCTTVSQPIAELFEEESPANRSSSLSFLNTNSVCFRPPAFQTEGKLYLILDFLRGGDLFTRLSKEVTAV